MIPELQKLNPAVVKTARGKGLMNAIEIKPTESKKINADCRNITFLLGLECFLFKLTLKS